MEKLRSFGVNSDMLVTFYNALICSFIMFGSLCWGGNSSKFDNWRLEKVVKKEEEKKKKKKASHVLGKPRGSFKTLHEKKLQKFNANIK